MTEALGNPLALLELSAALSDVQRSALAALPALLPLSRRLRALFGSRIRDLPAATGHLLLLAALEGTGSLSLLRAAAAGWGDVDDLAPAERAGLVHTDEHTGLLRFRHPLIRSAVVELSASNEVRRAHQALAAQLGDQPERRAWHLAAAAIEPDEEVASLLEQAASQAERRGDAIRAVTALLRAAQLSPRECDRSRLLARAACLSATVTGELPIVPRLLAEARRAALVPGPTGRCMPQSQTPASCSTAPMTSTGCTACSSGRSGRGRGRRRPAPARSPPRCGRC